MWKTSTSFVGWHGSQDQKTICNCRATKSFVAVRLIFSVALSMQWDWNKVWPPHHHQPKTTWIVITRRHFTPTENCTKQAKHKRAVSHRKFLCEENFHLITLQVYCCMHPKSEHQQQQHPQKCTNQYCTYYYELLCSSGNVVPFPQATGAQNMWYNVFACSQ